MKLYDEAIRGLFGSFDLGKARQLNIVDTDWQDVGDHNLILRADMAYELGGGEEFAVSATAVTCDDNLVPNDQIYLLGPDLADITEDISYARIAIVRVKEDSLGDGNTLYNSIRKIEYVKYHINPEGYMTRISASSGREPVRVGKASLKAGLDFAKVGKMFIDAYHQNENVQAVKLIFITAKDVDYKALAEQSKHMEDITGTIDHILKNVVMDCGTCSLQKICDEVEGLRELHFSTLNK